MPKPTVEEKAKQMRSAIKRVLELLAQGIQAKESRTVHFHTVHAEVFLELVELYPELEEAIK